MPATRTPAAGEPKTKVLLVDDHAIVRQGLIQVLNREPDLTVCGEAEDAQQALDVLDATHPDFAIVDISLKGRNGIEVVKDFRTRRPEMPVLVLSMYDDSLYAERAIRAGAKGYIRKQEVIGKLMEAVRRVLAGHIYISDSLSSALVRRALTGREHGGAGFEMLTDRELEIFQLIGQGLANGKIAEKLCLSVKTVETHREHIKSKLGLKSGGELLRYAIEHAVHLDAPGDPPASTPHLPPSQE